MVVTPDMIVGCIKGVMEIGGKSWDFLAGEAGKFTFNNFASDELVDGRKFDAVAIPFKIMTNLNTVQVSYPDSDFVAVGTHLAKVEVVGNGNVAATMLGGGNGKFTLSKKGDDYNLNIQLTNMKTRGHVPGMGNPSDGSDNILITSDGTATPADMTHFQ
jgi:hypothetical protein